MDKAILFAGVALIWSIAVLIKLAANGGRTYEFGMWDGGLTLRGRKLGRTGALGFGAFTLTLAAVSVWLLAHA